MHEILSTDNLLALVTLTSLEIVLGIDNIVFIALLTGRLPVHQQAKARSLGLAGAMVIRILLLLSITWVMGLTAPLFGILGKEISGRDLILLLGGLFLVAKATYEIHHRIEGDEEEHGKPKAPSFWGVILMILLLDIVFSLDSVITAVGMAEALWVMIVAVVVAVGVMLISSGTITRFIERHPTLKMLALAFLILIGVMLVAEGWGRHVEKGYIYFAMAFSLGVEILNIRAGTARKAH